MHPQMLTLSGRALDSEQRLPTTFQGALLPSPEKLGEGCLCQKPTLSRPGKIVQQRVLSRQALLKSWSRSKSKAPTGRSLSKERAPTTSSNQETLTPQVSWSQILSITAHSLKPTCNERTNLQKEVTYLRRETSSLKAAISQLTQSNTSAQHPQAGVEKKT
ncbi:hypothetical protein HPB48_021416 [Haemaphysalis longicornis]|uniref:Uncharacterized protein n=1 Tax=Haemaphysalis longicornis TaxID=44386 RepID=A0A9J6FTI5_HAELO|nr:hypothetical protein HPB48_021416 [Haemaphysalis longicornis]